VTRCRRPRSNLHRPERMRRGDDVVGADVTVAADILIFDPYKVTRPGGSARVAILSDVMSEDLRKGLIRLRILSWFRHETWRAMAIETYFHPTEPFAVTSVNGRCGA
jgi:hypothetical protein